MLEQILNIIKQRISSKSKDSYTVGLINQGRDKIERKILEESYETAMASRAGDKRQVIYEMADVWYHCLVLLASLDLDVKDVYSELENRIGKKKKEYDKP